jgi:nucleoid-associated protein YgaU
MAENDSMARAIVINLDKDPAGRNPIRCRFNPKEYSFTKQNSWKEGEAPAQNTTQLQFSGGKPATLQMQLFFDTYGDREDVRKKYTDAFWELMMIDSSLKDKKNKYGRPPRVRFQWGETWAFEAVITSMKQQFTLFLPTGIPVRATLDVTFQQVKDTAQLAAQNPTSGGMGGERIWRVVSGDTLAWIAYREYGDATKWRLIAEANKLTRVRELIPGAVLVIPNE